jgi:tRNA(Ile)-lysidine synthase
MSRPKNEIEKVLKNSLPLKSKLLIAVSGGKDSVALFYACVRLAEKLKLTLAVAHVDHSLRKKSASDLLFVKKLAEKEKVKFFGTRIKKQNKKENTEAWGRKERYKFFKLIQAKNKFDWVLTAHTANDVAETFLMRLLSNKELNSIERVDKERRLLRPLLSVSTEEIQSYIKENKLKFIEDETNKEETFLRNRVRHRLLPLMSELFDKRISETLSERARAIQEDIEGLNLLFSPALKRLKKYKLGTKVWLKATKDEINKMPEFLAWRLVEQLIKPLLSFNLGRAKSKEALRLFRGEIQAIQLPGGKNLRLAQGGLLIK